MNEFHKPFEYEEDDPLGGFLLLFFIMLLSVETFIGASAIIRGYNALQENSIMSIVLLALGAVYIAGIFFTCIALKAIRRIAIFVSKAFLIFRTVFLTSAFVITTIAIYHDPNAVNQGASRLFSKPDILVYCLIMPVLYTLVFSLGWYWYLLKSKRVKNFTEAAAAERARR